jgi:DNA-binding CsgD family transcriptional regulator
MRYRTLDVLLLLQKGHRPWEIARILERAKSTIWAHIQIGKGMFRVRTTDELRDKLASMTPDALKEFVKEMSPRDA